MIRGGAEMRYDTLRHGRIDGAPAEPGIQRDWPMFDRTGTGSTRSAKGIDFEAAGSAPNASSIRANEERLGRKTGLDR